MIFHSFGSLSVTSAGGVSFAAASATLPYVVVRADDDPRGDLGRAVLRAHDAGAERDLQAEGEPGADGGGADDERAPIDLRGLDDHGFPPMPSPRREWPRAPAGTSRSGRCW